MSRITLLLALLGAPLLSCDIMTSEIEPSSMQFIKSNWHSKTVFVIDIHSNRQRSFTDAYNAFENETRNNILNIVCTKDKRSGVANYLVTWQAREKAYYFTATFDEFIYK